MEEQPKLTPAQECVLRYLNFDSGQWWSIRYLQRKYEWSGYLTPVERRLRELIRMGYAELFTSMRLAKITPAGIEAARQLQRKDGES